MIHGDRKVVFIGNCLETRVIWKQATEMWSTAFDIAEVLGNIRRTELHHLRPCIVMEDGVRIEASIHGT